MTSSSPKLEWSIGNAQEGIAMTNKTPHPHAKLIAEWIKNTNREIEGSGSGLSWMKAGMDAVVRDVDGDFTFRFADMAEKSKIVSSLTLQEMHEIFYGKVKDGCCGFRGIANVATQRAIEDLKVPHDDWFDFWVGENDRDVPVSIIQQYIDDLKEGKL